MTTVAFLGPPGTYTHQVALSYFGPESRQVAFDSIANVFEAIGRETTYGVAPIENTTAGPVLETTSLLRSTKLVTRDLIPLKIGHSLIANKNHGNKLVTRVYSHIQGLEQCAGYLDKNYPQAERIAIESTSKAAQIVSQETESTEASLAICSAVCAEVYAGLYVLDSNIQDAGNANTTRFIVLSLPETPLDPRYPQEQ